MLRYCVSGGIISNGKSVGMAQKSVFAAAKKFLEGKWGETSDRTECGGFGEIYRRKEDFAESVGGTMGS